MKNILNLLTVLILAGVLLFAIDFFCNRPDSEIIIKTDTIYSEKIITEIRPDTVIYENVEIIKDTIYVNNEILTIDTVYVYINDYLASKFYSDTVFNNDTLKLVINDTINRNEIKHRHVKIQTYNKTILSDPNEFFLSGGVRYLNEPVIVLGCEFNRNKWIFGIEVGTDKSIAGKFGYRINR